MSELAIAVVIALLAGQAFVASGAAAVDVGLEAVLPVVGALIGDASERRLGVAGVGCAVRIGAARLAYHAGGAGAAAAVDVGLEPVLVVVVALVGDAEVRVGVAGVR